jgi:hypothetical protein
VLGSRKGIYILYTSLKFSIYNVLAIRKTQISSAQKLYTFTVRIGEFAGNYQLLDKEFKQAKKMCSGKCNSHDLVLEEEHVASRRKFKNFA